MGKRADSISVTGCGRFGTWQPRAMRRYSRVHTTPGNKAEGEPRCGVGEEGEELMQVVYACRVQVDEGSSRGRGAG